MPCLLFQCDGSPSSMLLLNPIVFVVVATYYLRMIVAVLVGCWIWLLVQCNASKSQTRTCTMIRVYYNDPGARKETRERANGEKKRCKLRKTKYSHLTMPWVWFFFPILKSFNSQLMLTKWKSEIQWEKKAASPLFYCTSSLFICRLLTIIIMVPSL